MTNRPTSLFALALCLAASAASAEEPIAPPAEVTATRSSQASDDTDATPTETIDRAAIEAFSARDAAELIEGHPSLKITRTHRGAGVQMQGLDGKHVLILVDGERIAGRRGEEIDLSRFNTADIERVEIIRGAASALYGPDAVAGVINIITRRATGKETVRVNLRAGTQAQRTLSLAASGGNKVAAIDFGATYDGAGAFRLNEADPGTLGSAYDRIAAHLAFRYAPSRAFTLDARVAHTFRRSTGVVSVALPDDLDGNARWRLTDHNSAMHATELRVAPTFRFGLSELTVSASATFASDLLVQTQRGGRDGPTREPSDERIVNLGSRWTTSPHPAHLVTIGVDSFIETLDSTRLATGSAQRVRAGVFAQDVFTLDEDLAFALTPGLRLDLDTYYDAVITPRLAAAITPAPAVTVRASAGLGFRGPGFRELHFSFDNPAVGYSVVGNPELRPEHSISGSLGATLRVVPDRLSLRGELFHHWLRDLITTTTAARDPGATGERFVYTNVGRATSRGFELAADIGPIAGLTATLSYSLIDARDAIADLRLTGRALHNADVRVAYRSEVLPIDASLRVSVIGPRVYEIASVTTPVRAEAPAHVLMDARVAWRINASTQLYVAGDNLLNAGHTEALPIRPQSVWLGLEGTFH